jgi:hypothetical protein
VNSRLAGVNYYQTFDAGITSPYDIADGEATNHEHQLILMFTSNKLKGAINAKNKLGRSSYLFHFLNLYR